METDAFDLWLRRGLQSRYAASLAEPLPPTLLDLAVRPTGLGSLFPDRQHRDAVGRGEDAFGERVRECAYFLWLKEGRPEGRALEHWMAAFVSEVMQEASSLTGARTIHSRHPPTSNGRWARRRTGEA